MASINSEKAGVVITVDGVTEDSTTLEEDDLVIEMASGNGNETSDEVIAMEDESVNTNGTQKEVEQACSQKEGTEQADGRTSSNPDTGSSGHAKASDGKSLCVNERNGPKLSADRSGARRRSPSPFRHHVKDDTPPLDEQSLLLVSTLVLDAKYGRNLPFQTGDKYTRSYLLYHKWYLRYLLYFFITFNHSLAFFEKPALKGAALPYWATMILEAICLSFFLFRKLHVFHFQERGVFWRDTKNYMILGTIILTVIDMIGYIVWINVAPNTHPVRWSRSLRPLFIINFSDGKQVRRAFRNIRRTVPDIMHVLILFIFSVLLFALLALKLFVRRDHLIYPDGQPYFKNYGDSVWDLYVLVTTANDPDVMMPAYDYDNWFVLFFAIFIIINLYIFMSIVLATIYYNYKKNLKNEIKTAVYCKRKQLARAFDILKVEKNGREVVTFSRWMQFMKMIMPQKSPACLELMMKVLDVDNDEVVYKEQFLNMADLLHVELTEVKDRLTLLEQLIPHFYNHPVSNFVKLIVRHKVFRYAFDLLIFANAFFIAFDVDEADWFFLVVFTIEIMLKLYVFGPRQFAMRLWNIFDFFVIGAAVIATIVEGITGESHEEFSTLDILLVLRVMRLFKLFGSIQRFKIVVQTIVNIGPSIGTYGGVMFVFFYFFAIIGMEVFQGLISYHGYNESFTAPADLWCGNPLLQNTTFYRLHYCSNNFNTIPQAFVLLMELMVVNQWHVLTSGFVFVTNKAARIYFFLFHLSFVVLVLNIFTAFVLEAFILEYSLRAAPKFESVVEAKIKQLGLGIGMKAKPTGPPQPDELELVSEEQPPAQTETPTEEDSESDTESLPDISSENGLRFHLKKRSRKKTEVLLQQMFQTEIDIDDLGPKHINEGVMLQPIPRKLTLDTVG